MDEAAAAVSAHLGEVDENKINNMAYIWFNAVLEALGKRLNYESISNIYGNSFAKDSAKIVQAANPLVKNGGSGNGSIANLAGQIKTIKADNKEAAKAAVQDQLGSSLDWAEGLF